MDDDKYQDRLDALSLHLVRWQTGAIERGDRTIIVLEGRDAAGKDGTIRALTPRLSQRNTRVVALAKPTAREQGQWYFQRYVNHLPAAGETAIFNRSWYNRAGVEPVNGFCTPEEHAQFLADAPRFEAMLAGDGFTLIKVWLDVSKVEQAERLKERATEPLKALKRSPLDAVAQEKWDAYTAARDEMLTSTSTDAAPWWVMRSNKKERARLELIQALLHRLGAGEGVEKPDAEVVFPFEVAALTDGRLQR